MREGKGELNEADEGDREHSEGRLPNMMKGGEERLVSKTSYVHGRRRKG